MLPYRRFVAPSSSSSAHYTPVVTTAGRTHFEARPFSPTISTENTPTSANHHGRPPASFGTLTPTPTAGSSSSPQYHMKNVASPDLGVPNHGVARSATQGPVPLLAPTQIARVNPHRLPSRPGPIVTSDETTPSKAWPPAQPLASSSSASTKQLSPPASRRIPVSVTPLLSNQPSTLSHKQTSAVGAPAPRTPHPSAGILDQSGDPNVPARVVARFVGLRERIAQAEAALAEARASAEVDGAAREKAESYAETLNASLVQERQRRMLLQRRLREVITERGAALAALPLERTTVVVPEPDAHTAQCELDEERARCRAMAEERAVLEDQLKHERTQRNQAEDALSALLAERAEADRAVTEAHAEVERVLEAARDGALHGKRVAEAELTRENAKRRRLEELVEEREDSELTGVRLNVLEAELAAERLRFAAAEARAWAAADDMRKHTSEVERQLSAVQGERDLLRELQRNMHISVDELNEVRSRSARFEGEWQRLSAQLRESATLLEGERARADQAATDAEKSAQGAAEVFRRVEEAERERAIAEEALESVKREQKEPFLVPALVDAMKELARFNYKP